jgi:hypothetical protein
MGRLPWSWPALAVCVPVLGLLLIASLYLVAPFKQGLDADMIPAMMRMELADIALGALQVGACGLPFVLLGLWLANRSNRPRRWFLILTPLAPAMLLFMTQAWFIVSAALEPPSGIMPFPANSWFYLPNWLTIATFAIAFWATAQTYLLMARLAGERGY